MNRTVRLLCVLATIATVAVAEKAEPKKELKRPAKTVRCRECQVTGEKYQGAYNWKMCDTCLVTYCFICFRDKRKLPTHCTEHEKRGNWLTADGRYGDMTFK